MSKKSTTSSNTPYDDVFRTMLNDCSSLIIPVINEVFGENYRGDEEITFYPNEHFIQGQDTSTKEKITDSCFQVIGIRKKKYHLECQSRTPDALTVRIVTPGGEVSYKVPVMKTQKYRNQRICKVHNCRYVSESCREDYRKI